MQKAHGHHPKMAPTACKHQVSDSVSLLLKRFFSPFPHGTSALSVVGEYLALEDGPPGFPRGPSNTGLSPSVVELSSSLLLTTHESETPALQPRLNEFSRFGLIPVRSPLLGESRLISLPAGTEMFHFPALAHTDLCIQSGVMEHDFHWVAPFRDPRIKGCFAPPRGLSQHTTSFIAFRRQGILLSTYSRNKLPFHPYSIVNEPFPKRTFRKVPVVTPIRIHEDFAPSFSARLTFSILLLLVELDGIEPTASCVQSRRSPK